MTNSKYKFSMDIFDFEVKRRLLFSIFSLFILNSCVIPIKENFLNEDDVILEEEFIDNKIGWIEEINNIHELEIKNGSYHIYSKDTSYSYTSTAPLDKAHLYGLRNFEIICNFLVLKTSPVKTYYGIFFESGILRHNFILENTGLAYCSEFNYATNETKELLSMKIHNLDFSKVQTLKIFINRNEYYFYVNDRVIGPGKLNGKSWQDIRIIVSSGTDLLIDNFKILKRIDE